MPADETLQRPMESPVKRVLDRAAQLHVVFPLSLLATIALDERPLVLGRQPGSEGHALEDGTVSRRHAEVSWDDATGAHRFRELGSRNGSRVDGERVSDDRVPLEDGSVVRTGDVIMIYERGAVVQRGDSVSRDAIPGRSAAMVRVRAAVAAASADPSPVLLVGETGTGKEFIAREIHRLSGRSGPLVAVNCAALSPQLIESQLFGHRRGSFTGADKDEPGLFRAAHAGTILLDEVGELPVDLQAKLLRVLQDGEVLPVGATRPVAVDARVVAATLRDLRALADAGDFRLDLYARLSPWEITVPPLRRRRADLLEWIERLDRQWHLRRGHAPAPVRFEANAAERLMLHSWPDNLRGIDRLVHHFHSDPSLAIYDLPASWLADAPPTSSARAPAPDERRRRERLSKEALVEALAKHDGSVRATAKYLGRERRLIYRWMDLYGLREK